MIKEVIKCIGFPITLFLLIIGYIVAFSYLVINDAEAWKIWGLGIITMILVLLTISIALRGWKITFGIGKPHKRNIYRKILKNNPNPRFKEIYDYVNSEYAKGLEEKRKKVLRSFAIGTVLYGIVIFIIIKMIPSGILFVIPYAYFLYKYEEYKRLYVKEFKEKVIKNFLECININLNYKQDGGQNLINYYLEAEFEEEKFKDYQTDDYIEGYNQDGTNIEMCNVLLRNINKDKMYEGIFSVSQLNSYIVGEVRIKKNKKQHRKLNKVEMDSKEFEKYFDVYSNSNILTMELLTHEIMEELERFYNTYKIELEIVIKNSRIYTKFNTGAMFEPNILRKSTNMNILFVYYSILKFVTNFTIKINKLLKDVEV